MRKLLIIAAVFFVGLNVAAQQPEMIPFELNGKINLDTGTLNLVFSTPSEYYPGKKREQTAKIINGNFSIKGVLSYPESFFLQWGNQ